jgi:hypothetical protein
MATQKVVVSGSSVTAGQMKDFWRQVEDRSINFFMFREFLEHRNPFSISFIDWLKVYEVLGMSAEYVKFAKTNEVVLAAKSGLWTGPILKGATCNKVIAAFRKLGVDVSLYTDDLDTNVPTNDRDPNKTGSHVVSFASNEEADENLKNLSANKLAEQGVKGITLLERLILELGYFLTTGKHLDEKNVTLCSGSRSSDGHVPCVGWRVDDRELGVGWCSPGSAGGDLRARAVVS